MTRTLLLIAASSLALAACATGSATNNSTPYSSKVDAALDRAASRANASGGSEASLSFLEQLYKRNPSNVESTVKYARALRDSGNSLKAATILAPLATGPKATSDLKTEYASILLTQGNFKQAEKIARDAITQDEKNYRAFQTLGIALDAQEFYPQAEVAFRKALEMWQGDPVPILNNLALNLANQDRLSESIEILQKAQASAPGRQDIERNLRIIQTLNETSAVSQPKRPTSKPKISVN